MPITIATPPSKRPVTPALSDFEIDERAAEAEALLQNKVLQWALDDIYSRHYGILMDAEVGSLTASTAHATLKALEDVRHQLEQYISDRKMRLRYPTKGEKNG